ncbi:hypothetical protein HX082_02735 [Myroides odoratimimus]|uniref:hypothetical protein n=1 Tax=Myroides odoratimimus TaxID=76832 RepID=UPI002576ADAB|nr:hypothetical protein [Myroides odoratimimus]MDM1508310.1 hypothetical protein [Myroides odoratimimus]
MINYFYKNKGKLTTCEDSLTSLTFDLLSYLPEDIFWNILKGSLYHDYLPYACGKLLEIDYWAKWDAQGTLNSNYVEPDILLRFTDFDVIIEAKRYNIAQQKKEQMENEIRAYSNMFGQQKKAVFFIQVGGLNNLTEEVFELKELELQVYVCKTDWNRILDQVDSLKRRLNSIDSFTTNSHIRIIDNLIKGFELHQYYKKQWLCTMPSINVELSEINIFRDGK